MRHFDSIHLFLDESGQVQKAPRRSEPLLVGGILLFGSYDETADDTLRDQIREQVNKVGGSFPEDLHFGQSSLATGAKQRFLQAVAGDLRTWSGEERAAYGVHIVHKGDVFGSGEGILSERHYDNRYISMLWSLIEHLVFVDRKVTERLSARATFHLHIASRVYSFDPNVTPAHEVEGLGWKVLLDRRRPGRKLAVNVLLERDLVTMVRMSLRQRWVRSAIQFGRVNVDRLDYESGSSPALLYLADAYLGLARFSELARQRRVQPLVKSVLVPTFRRLEYGPWLELLARMEAAIEEGQAEQYLTLAEEYDALREQHEWSALEPVVKRQQKEVAVFFRESLRPLINMMDNASRIVDRPGGAAQGLAKAELARNLRKSAGIESLESEVLLLQIRLSYANHTGDVQAAENVWGEYLALESRLHELGADGLRLISELRNRRAVNLTDQFRYNEAEGILSDIVTERESWEQELAGRFGIAIGAMPSRELGACLGSLGQVYAFRGSAGDFARAETCFRRAMSQFKMAADIDRQWVYLGHLACDQREEGRALWEETLEKNAALRAVSGSQYMLAIQSKGVLVFGPEGSASSFLSQWEASQPLERFTEEERGQHPFGLIHQTLGMLYARAWQETGSPKSLDRAVQQFDLAYETMIRGRALLKVLAHVARLRKYLFLGEARGLGRSATNSLSQTLLVFKGQLAEHFGASAWSEDENGNTTGFFGQHDPGPSCSQVDRARSLIRSVRFNYW